jgi:fatty-acyl-CoA synthase/fatty acid CoA ligase FadD22
VRGPDGGALPPGRTGTLWVSGPTLLLGYLGHPDVPLPVRDGWLSTGDRAEVDADGFVRLRGRSDDLEKVGGISVSPLEIEAVLVRHPAVTEVAVAGVFGEDGASRLQAFVVPAPGAAPSDSVAADLVALARAELAPFKVPRSVVFVDGLPRTATGKLRRFVLRSGRWPPAQPSTSGPNRSR